MADAVALNATNAAILDAIRNEASSQYQQRIPSATKGSVAATMAALQMYNPMMNEFVDALVNRIGQVIIKSKIWNNPFAVFKRGMLPFGSTIEEIYVGLVEAQRWDSNTVYEDVFKQEKPDVRSLFHSVNRQDYYPVSVNEELLKRAFLDENGLQSLVGAIMEAPYNSDYWDEYLIMKNLFAEYAKNDQFFKVQVPDLASSTALEADMKHAVRMMRTYASMVGFMSDRYNASNVPTFTPPDELYVFINPEFEAAMDVEVLAAAFNMDKATYFGHRILVDDFGIEGCQAIMTDKDFFVCADTKIDFTSIYNPKGLSWNYWLHHWGVYSVSKFSNAIMFTTEAGTSASTPVIALTDLAVDFATVDGVKPTYAVLGGETRLEATVTGTVTPATEGVSVPQGVVWAITDVEVPTHIGTFIDHDGVLHVDEHEQNDQITVRATTTYIDPDTALSEQTALTESLVVGIGSAADVTAPDAPVISTADASDGTVTGTGEAGATVHVLNVTLADEAVAVVAANGSWTTDALTIAADDHITAYQVDAHGNVSANSVEFVVVA